MARAYGVDLRKRVVDAIYARSIEAVSLHAGRVGCCHWPAVTPSLLFDVPVFETENAATCLLVEVVLKLAPSAETVAAAAAMDRGAIGGVIGDVERDNPAALVVQLGVQPLPHGQVFADRTLGRNHATWNLRAAIVLVPFSFFHFEARDGAVGSSHPPCRGRI